jgi:hypothetical protein
MDSDSGNAPESFREEDNNKNKGITWISSKMLVNSPYLLLMNCPNALRELRYKI